LERCLFVLLWEKVLVTHEIRALVLGGADPDAIHRQAIAQGTESLRQAGLLQVSAGRLDLEEVVYRTPDDEGPA
jgi:type II secretory ATPase GspE/PulE/Tfp pilus assembly ATPase PilB-like protein